MSERFHERIRRELLEAVRPVLERNPDLEGLVICCAWDLPDPVAAGAGVVLGQSDPMRLARALQQAQAELMLLAVRSAQSRESRADAARQEDDHVGPQPGPEDHAPEFESGATLGPADPLPGSPGS